MLQVSNLLAILIFFIVIIQGVKFSISSLNVVKESFKTTIGIGIIRLTNDGFQLVTSDFFAAHVVISMKTGMPGTDTILCDTVSEKLGVGSIVQSA